ncbi:MAG TPA: M3 family oligoendopeptidase [Acidimicrobiales bacterium]|nr:M3 family oligoendopeptidase [Acidimicrobiales bacterium]
MATIDAAPRWDMTTVFPSPGSREFAAAHEALGADLDRLTGLYDRHAIRGGEAGVPTAADLAAFDEVITATNTLLEQARTLNAYLSALFSADARDDEASTLYSQLQAKLAGLQKLTTRFEAWVARFGPDALTAASQVAADHAYALQRAVVSASHLMSEAQESLYADLRLTGSSAWDKLHGDVTALLVADVDGVPVPITQVRGMATNPDSGLRERAYRAELAAWETVAIPLGAALNAIKGETNTVNARRGWPDALAAALQANNVERPALDAMQEAVVGSFPQFRRFLAAKARLLGHDGALPWWDLFAPIPGEQQVSWPAATLAVEEAFASYSAELAGLAHRALHERWVDAEVREGKRGGAFCLSVKGDESRVLLNFDDSFQSVQTLAHELGHAYHNTQLAGRTPLQRRTPMALAETASIFCETIMVSAGLAAATDRQRLALLNVDLQGACQIVVDIHSRFLFEREVFSRREKGTLPVAELCHLMTEAQRATYGDGLRADALHPYMWAVKPHYYSSAYYNWPYCFELLFGIGLYARYREDPERFRSGYVDLLSSTGLGSAADVAARFAIDITSVDFWAAGLDVVGGRIADFEHLVAAS